MVCCGIIFRVLTGRSSSQKVVGKGDKTVAAIKWDAISDYIEEALGTKGLVQHEDLMAMALANNASDEVVDALDAIGSRVFRSASEVRNFLVSQGYVAN